MTADEIKNLWVRYMHRNDINGDLDETLFFANQKVEERLMYATPDTADLLANYPRAIFHAGMTYLAELAQDDEQLPRETRLFEIAIQDHSLRRSIDAGPAVMTKGA